MKRRGSVLYPVVMLLVGLVLWVVAMRLAWLSGVYYDAYGEANREIAGQLQLWCAALLGVAAVVFLPIGVRRLARRRRTPLELALEPGDLLASLSNAALVTSWSSGDQPVVPRGLYSVVRPEHVGVGGAQVRASREAVEFWDFQGVYRHHRLAWRDLLGIDKGFLVVEAHLQPAIKELWDTYRYEPEPGEPLRQVEDGVDCSPNSDLDLFRESAEDLLGRFTKADEPGSSSDRFRARYIWLTCRWVPQGDASSGLKLRHTLVDGQMAEGPWVQAINRAILPMIDEDYALDPDSAASRKKVFAMGVKSPLINRVLRLRVRYEPSRQFGLGWASGEPPGGVDTAFYELDEFSLVSAEGRLPAGADREDSRTHGADEFIAAMGRARSNGPSAALGAGSAGRVESDLVSGVGERRVRTPIWTRVWYPTKAKIGWAALVALVFCFIVPPITGESWEPLGEGLNSPKGMCLYFTSLLVFMVLLLSSNRLGRSARPLRLSRSGGRSVPVNILWELGAFAVTTLVGGALGCGVTALFLLI